MIKHRSVFPGEHICVKCYRNIKSIVEFECVKCGCKVKNKRRFFTNKQININEKLCVNCYKSKHIMVKFVCEYCKKEVEVFKKCIYNRPYSLRKFCVECLGTKIKNFKIFVCRECGKESRIQKVTLKKRKDINAQNICQKCYKEKYYGGTKNKSYYPPELADVWKDKIWDYDRVRDLFDVIKSKKKVRFICDVCGKIDEISINGMKKRKICGTRKICRKCALKVATSSEEWRDKNSKAQLISQNKPEVLEKQRKSQLDLMQRDPFYIEKRRNKCFVSGYINDIHFDSSWELLYIAYCLENKDLEYIKRYDGYLVYKDKNGVERRYFPDFYVKFINECEKIIEIKGQIYKRQGLDKAEAAISIFGDKYYLYTQKDLYAMGIKVRTESYLKHWYNIIFSKYDVKLNRNKITANLMEKIKVWQKSKIL